MSVKDFQEFIAPLNSKILELGALLSVDMGDLSRDPWSLLPGANDFLAEIRTRKYGTLNVIVAHKPADVTGSGDDGTARQAAARGLNTDCATRVIYRQAAGDIPDHEMETVFNLGLGMLGVVAAADGYRALDAVRTAGHEAWLVGEIEDGHGRVVVSREQR